MASSLERAGHWLDVGRPERALEELDAAEAGDLGSAFFELRTRSFIQLARWEEAESNARRGLEVDPEDILLMYWLALAVEERPGGQRESELLLLRCLARQPEDVQFLTSYATLLIRFDQSDKAKRLIERAAEADPESIEVDLAWMQWWFGKGRDKLAAVHARNALAKDPNHPAALAFAGAFDASSGRATRGSRRLKAAAVQSLGNRDIADSARDAIDMAHPLMLPVTLVQRLPLSLQLLTGVAVVLIAQVINAAGAPRAAVVLMGCWVAFVLYFWTAIGAAHVISKRRNKR